MRTSMIVPMAAMLALAACGDKAPTADAPQTNAAVADANASGNAAAPDQLEQVLALNDRQRNTVFVRALLDANLPCDAVTGSERIADRNGLPVWKVTCAGKDNNHIISITRDGTANIVSRSD